MMYAKTFCKPGSFMTVIPAGLQTTLEYDRKGKLTKVYVGYDELERKDVTDKLLESVRNCVPTSIHLTDGNSFVTGVFYTDTIIPVSGNLPDCTDTAMIEGIINNTIDVQFYAGNIVSFATKFGGANPVRNWLQMAGFNLLPGYLVPANLTPAAFENLVYNQMYPFRKEAITGYIFYEGFDVTYHQNNISQHIVKKVQKFLNVNGQVKASIVCEDNTLEVNYSDIIKFNINAETLITIGIDGKIARADVTDNKKRDKRSANLTCEICHKPFTAPQAGVVECDDLHCPSHLYGQIAKMCKVLNLPELSESDFLKDIKDNTIRSILDVFSLPNYRELKLTITLGQALNACIPASVCADENIFTMFANTCNNSIDTMRYYIDHPQQLVNDLSIRNLFTMRLIEWLSDDYNAAELTAFIQLDNITIDSQSKKFDGAPIFRDKTVAITGKFRHGSLDEVSAIIRSYSADVVTTLTDKVQAVVVGSLHEDINGGIVSQARDRNIPVFEEDDFFLHYGIDEDLQMYLV